MGMGKIKALKIRSIGFFAPDFSNLSNALNVSSSFSIMYKFLLQ